MPPSADAPVARDVDTLHCAAPAALAIERDETVDQHPPRDPLHVGVECGSDREAAVDTVVPTPSALDAAIEPVLAVHFNEPAPHLLGKVVGRIDLRAERTDVDLEGLGFCNPRLLGADVAVLGHLIEDPIAPLGGLLRLAEGMVVVGRLRQRGEIRGLLEFQLGELLAEIVERRGSNPIRSDAEIDLVEIELEDLLLGEGPLDADGENRLLQLAIQVLLARQQEVLGDLLRDGGGTLRAPLAPVLEILVERAGDAREVESAVLEEAPVLRRQEGVDDDLWHRR